MNDIGLQALINKGDARAKQLRKELEVDKSKIRLLEIKMMQSFSSLHASYKYLECFFLI